MMMQFSRLRPIRIWAVPILLLAVFLLVLPVRAEVSVSFSPEDPRVGDYVDVAVTPGREGFQSVTYALSTPEGKVFSGKEDTHLQASFRPRTENEYTLTVTVSYGKKDQESVSVIIPVSGAAPVQEGPEVIYSQKDGWWKKKSYSTTSLEKAGCAIFTLSHAVHRLGFSGEDTLPDAMGITYANCLVEGGTANERLLTQAGEHYDFITQDDLSESPADIEACLRRGDYFSFSIVIGHIALADGISEDGTKVHIIDSAPSATFERIKKGNIYYQDENGDFVQAARPEDLPGVRWFFETGHCSGTGYWLDLSYCARRGMRLIRPSWLKWKKDGDLKSVLLDQPGTMQSKIVLGEETLRVPTRELQWVTVGAGSPQLAMVSKKTGTGFKTADSKPIPGYKKIPAGTLMTALQVDSKQIYVFYKGSFGYVSRKDADLLEASSEDFETGTVSVNGRTGGTAVVKVRSTPSAKGRVIAEWKVGTPVALAEKKDGFSLCEGRGARGWVQDKYLTLEQASEDEGEEDGQEIDEGE